MKIIDGSVYSKEELIEIINHLLSVEYEFAKYPYIVNYQSKKVISLLDQTHDLVVTMQSLPHTREGLLERLEIGKKIDAIHKKVDRIEKSIVID